MNSQLVKDPQNPSGPVMIHGHKVYVDRNICIGAAACIAIATKTFILDDQNKAVILDTADQDTLESIILAAQACPVSAIIIENDKGERVFPK